MHAHPLILAILMLKNGLYRASTTSGPGEYILGLGKELEQLLFFMVIEGRVYCDRLVRYMLIQGDSLHFTIFWEVCFFFILLGLYERRRLHVCFNMMNISLPRG